jgi:hypothetical protein
MFVVGKSGGSQLGVRLSHSELQVGGVASPSVSEGALGLLIEVIFAEAAQRAEGHLRQVARSSGERPMAGYARKEKQRAVW